jgi:hypothetical protein
MIQNSLGKLTGLFSKQFPDKKDIVGVYAVIVFLLYSWMLVTSFYMLPSWMFYLTIGQILSLYAYSFSLNLFESILLLAGILILEFTIFLGFKKDQEFQSRSILLVVFLLGVMMTRLIVFKGYEESSAFVSSEFLWWGIGLPTSLLLAVVGAKMKWLQYALNVISERLTIFLYIYIPLSFFALIIVLIRNIS